MVLDEKQIYVILLFEFKMDHKAAETTYNINNASGPGTTTECTGQWLLKKFCQDDESLEEEGSSWPPGVDNDQLRAIIKADPLTTTWDVAKELNANLSMVVRHLRQIVKVKKVNE